MATAACRRAVSYTLIGPPAGNLRAAAAAAVKTPTATGDPFVDQLDVNFNKPITTPPPKQRTENNSPTFGSSGDPCLDFFFHVVPGTPAATVTSLLAKAWAAEPVTALRLACNLRGVRGTGKADRDGFYAAALWMHDCHPDTLALNARPIAEIGYLKDLPEILHRIVNGDGRIRRFPARKTRRKITREEALVLRKMRVDAAARAVERYRRDPRYRFLHDCTADLFAELLAEDLQMLEINLHEDEHNCLRII